MVATCKDSGVHAFNNNSRMSHTIVSNQREWNFTIRVKKINVNNMHYDTEMYQRLCSDVESVHDKL